MLNKLTGQPRPRLPSHLSQVLEVRLEKTTQAAEDLPLGSDPAAPWARLLIRATCRA